MASCSRSIRSKTSSVLGFLLVAELSLYLLCENDPSPIEAELKVLEKLFLGELAVDSGPGGGGILLTAAADVAVVGTLLRVEELPFIFKVYGIPKLVENSEVSPMLAIDPRL